MPDTAADVLAPNAPPMGIPDSNVPASLAPNPVPPITSNQPPVSPEQGAPLSDQIPMQTTPAYQDPEMVHGAAHQTWLGHVLHTVGGILGGDTTLHVTKHPDGSVEVTHDPSTEGEKWGRVAAAALGGAAHGIAVGQGPGGPARAAAAGIQTGLQAPQQRLDQANQEASVEEERMTRAANNALIHQKAYQETLVSQQLKTKIDQQSADQINDFVEGLKSSPDAKEFGVINNVQDLMKIAAANQDFLKSHTDLSLKAVPVPKPGGGTELHAIATDLGDDEQPVGDSGMKVMQISVDPTTNKPTLTSVPAHSSEKVGKVRMGNQGTIAQFIGLSNNWEKTNKPTQLKTLPEMNVAIENEPDAQKKADLIKARDTTFSQEMKLRQAGRNVNPPATPQTIGNWGTLLADPKSGVTLANVPQRDRAGVINAMQANGQKLAKPLTAKELDRSDLAGNAVDNIEEAQRILERRPDMFGPAGYGKTQFQKLMEGGDPDAMAYLTAINLANLPAVGIHGVRGKYALEDLSKLDSNLYLNADSMRNVLSEIHRSASEFKGAGGRQMDTPPAPANQPNQPTQQNTPPPKQPPPAQAPPINLIPAGHDVTFKNHGGVWRNDNGVATKVRDN